MSKVISFELKKLLSRIGIYLLVIFMAGLLVASMFLYNPTERADTTLSLSGETVSEMYEDFIDNGIKDNYDDIIEAIANDASTYVVDSSDYNIYNDAKKVEELFTAFDEACYKYTHTNATSEQHNILLEDIKAKFTKLQTTIITTLDYTKNATNYYILTTNTNYTALKSVMESISVNFTLPNTTHIVKGERYYNEYRQELYDCMQKLVYPNLSDVAEKYYQDGGYYSVITLRMEEIAEKIRLVHQQVIDEPGLEDDETLKDELNTLFNRYANSALVFEQAYKSSICVDALYSVKSKLDRSNLLGYADVSLYEQEEMVVEYEYYIEHNSNPKDYANSLSVTHTSNYKANAYDFSFFVMSIFSVVVIIFAIYLSAHTISGEINNNTMRFTAVRPVKRGSLFFGKYLAIMIISFILLAFGTIASFIVGAVKYGVQSADILMIINSSFVIVAHPVVVLLLFVLSLLLLVIFYSAVTIMFSTFIKSELFTMLLSLIFYCANMILPLFFGANSWLKFYPFTNMNLFAYFGTTRLTSDSVLGLLFNNVVYHGMNMWISLIYIIGIPILLLLIGKTIFRKRDL